MATPTPSPRRSAQPKGSRILTGRARLCDADVVTLAPDPVVMEEPEQVAVAEHPEGATVRAMEPVEGMPRHGRRVRTLRAYAPRNRSAWSGRRPRRAAPPLLRTPRACGPWRRSAAARCRSR